MGDNITVAVHINRLREKIEDDPQNPRYLQTVWGAGYRFCKKIIAILISAAMHRQIGELRAFEETEEADEGHDVADDYIERSRTAHRIVSARSSDYRGTCRRKSDCRAQKSTNIKNCLRRKCADSFLYHPCFTS